MMKQQENQSQLLLAPEQYETITQLASKQGHTISEIAQEIIRLGLETLERQKVQRQEALKRLNQRRLECHRLHGMYPGDIVAEVRAERQKQIDRVIIGE